MRRTASLVVLVLLVVACRDEDLDASPAAAPPLSGSSVGVAPDAVFYVQQLTRLDTFDAVMEGLTFEPVLPTHMPVAGTFQVRAAVVQSPVDAAAAGEPPYVSFFISDEARRGGFTLTEGEARAGQPMGGGTKIVIGEVEGRRLDLPGGGANLQWSACGLSFSLMALRGIDDADPQFSEGELLLVGRSLIEACS